MRDLLEEIGMTIRRNKLRTALTGLSVAWGIFILIVLLGAGNGLIHAFQSASGTMATNVVEVRSSSTTLPFNGYPAGRHIDLYERDARASQERFPDQVMQAQVQHWQGSVTVSTMKDYVSQSLIGVYPQYLDLGRFTMYRGRFLNKTDLQERRKVIVMHQGVAEQLFERPEEAIGKTVRINQLAFQVIGLYQDAGNTSDRPLYIPFTTQALLFGKGEAIDMFALSVQNLPTAEDNESFESNIRRMMASRKDYAPNDPGGIWIWNRLKQNQNTNEAMRLLTVALWVIGICTLLSGIVGVSNIMLITVKERTREFGICKALGARPAVILRMILLESVTITLLFGYIGLVAGIAATEYMSVLADGTKMEVYGQTIQMFKDPTVDVRIAVQATLALVVAGLLAGFFPARKAVSVRPVEALKAE